LDGSADWLSLADLPTRTLWTLEKSGLALCDSTSRLQRSLTSSTIARIRFRLGSATDASLCRCRTGFHGKDCPTNSNRDLSATNRNNSNSASPLSKFFRVPQSCSKEWRAQFFRSTQRMAKVSAFPGRRNSLPGDAQRLSSNSLRDLAGDPTEKYPFNPNGSINGITALCTSRRTAPGNDAASRTRFSALAVGSVLLAVKLENSGFPLASTFPKCLRVVYAKCNVSCKGPSDFRLSGIFFERRNKMPCRRETLSPILLYNFVILLRQPKALRL